MGCDMGYSATGGEGYSIPGKRGEVLKDEIAHEILSELSLIREELQNLTMAIRSASTSRNSENSYTRKPPKFYPRRAANPPDMRHSQGAASREANGIKTLQRTRDSSQKQFVASTHPDGSLSVCRLYVSSNFFVVAFTCVQIAAQSAVNSCEVGLPDTCPVTSFWA